MAGFSDVFEIRKCVNLVQLDLSTNLLQYLQGIECLVQLQRLNLADNKINNIDCLGSLTKLETLKLEGNLLGSLESLKPLALLCKLSHLSCCNTDKSLSNPGSIPDVSTMIFIPSNSVSLF